MGCHAAETLENCEILKGEEYAEVSEALPSIINDTPKLLGVFILGYAKLKMLHFAYMLIDFCDERDWSPILMDSVVVALYP